MMVDYRINLAVIANQCAAVGLVGKQDHAGEGDQKHRFFLKLMKNKLIFIRTCEVQWSDQNVWRNLLTFIRQL
jgi:hypothetical protein